MTGKSDIEWTGHTWNPTTGCDKVSAGCKYCYADTLAKRLQKMGVNAYKNGFKLTLHPDRIEGPLAREKPTLYFVNSMSDLFHNKVPFDFAEKIFRTIESTPQHTYQILTKRPDRMAQFFSQRKAPGNAWLGVTVENKKHGIPRIAKLRAIDAKIRFLSVEPLLEDLGQIDLTEIHWVIVGGESGAKARPMNIEWARSVREQCRSQKVKFFFKQWGAWGEDRIKRNKKANGRSLDGKTWDAMPVVFHPLRKKPKKVTPPPAP